MEKTEIREVESCLDSCCCCDYKNCLTLGQGSRQDLTPLERVKLLWREMPQEMMNFFNSQCSVWPLAVNYY